MNDITRRRFLVSAAVTTVALPCPAAAAALSETMRERFTVKISYVMLNENGTGIVRTRHKTMTYHDSDEPPLVVWNDTP